MRQKKIGVRPRIPHPPLIDRHARVDGSRPGINAPHQVVHILVSVLLEKEAHLHAARAMVADRHDRRLRIELAGARGHLAHRHVHRVRDRADLHFPGLAHVEQDRALAPCIVEPDLELRRRKLLHQKRNRGRCSALTRGSITVSKRSTAWNAPGSVQVTSRAVITGRSPTTAKSRPPAASCCWSDGGSTGVEPVSTIASYGAWPGQPCAASPTSRVTFSVPWRSRLRLPSCASAGLISTESTCAAQCASSAAKYPLPVPTSRTRSVFFKCNSCKTLASSLGSHIRPPSPIGICRSENARARCFPGTNSSRGTT